MAKSMTKSAIITHLSQKTTLSKKQVTDVMDQLATLATKEAKNVFVVPNFGRLVLANRKAPPDAILHEVYRRTGDKPFKNIDDVISREELIALSEGYKRVAGYDKERLKTRA